jgi:AcrR family transcriptional regulator
MAEQTRRRVLEAAYRLFVDRGYAGTTIAAVAQARSRAAT